jgi:uncharacterized protein
MSKSPLPHSITTSSAAAEVPAFVMRTAAPRAQAQPSALAWKRRIAKYSRWLHVYGSMASFVVVFFFAVTGLTLNHTEWFAGSERTTQVKSALVATWTKTAEDKDVAKLEIVEHLRKAHGVHGEVADFRVDADQCSVSFKAPGYTADAFIDRATGRYDLTVTRMGLVAIVNDLHKGRDSGPAWKLLIDLSAALLTFVSLSGLVLIYFIHKHRFAGLMSLAGGGAIVYLVYAVWVP